MRKLILIIVIIGFSGISSVSSAQGVRPFLKKMFNDIPDNYGVKITYVTGKVESFELASHTYSKNTGLFEFVTKDDLWNWVPLSSVERIEFDKRFSEIMAIKEKESQKIDKPQNKEVGKQ